MGSPSPGNSKCQGGGQKRKQERKGKKQEIEDNLCQSQGLSSCFDHRSGCQLANLAHGMHVATAGPWGLTDSRHDPSQQLAGALSHAVLVSARKVTDLEEMVSFHSFPKFPWKNVCFCWPVYSTWLCSFLLKALGFRMLVVKVEWPLHLTPFGQDGGWAMPVSAFIWTIHVCWALERLDVTVYWRARDY